MRAIEVMNHFIVRVRPTHSVKEVAANMRDQQVGVVCVVDDSQAPIGIITDRDIVVRGCAQGLSVEETAVFNLMTERPITCPLDTTVEEIHVLMKQHCIGRVLVVDEAGKLAGLVSLAELWHYESPLTAGPTSRRVTERELRVLATGSREPVDIR